MFVLLSWLRQGAGLEGADGKADLEKYVALAPAGSMAAKAKELIASIK